MYFQDWCFGDCIPL